MPISISSQVLGTLSVTVAETTGTLSVSVLATAPAVLSVELGTPGPAATIAVGTVTALAPDATPTVTNSGTNLNAVLDFGFPSGSTTQVRAQVRNETGATLTKGTVVYINGGAGNKVTVTKAIATGDATSAQTFGIVITDITNNQNGYVCVLGLLENLNTSAYTEGQQLYLSPTTAGALTTTKPSAPNHMVYVAIVERVHATQGTILVRIQNGYELEELHNVAISSVANSDLLVYESATSLWKNKSAATLGLLTSAAAAATYQTLSGMSAYLTTASAASTYQPIGSYLTDAPSDGTTYGRKDGAWYGVTSGGGTWGSITGTLSDQTDLQSALDAKYDASNPSAFIDASALTSYAPLNAPSFTSGITADGGVTIPGPSGDASLTYSGLDLGGASGGITFADDTVQTTAAVAGPSDNVRKADLIAATIFVLNASGDSTGHTWGNPPKFVLSLGSNWGIYDTVTTTYHAAALATGNTVYYSGTWGSGPWKVRVNGEDSTIVIS